MRLAIAAAVVAGLLAWPVANAWRDRRDPPGPPTPLAAGETPLAATCRLRAEFEALPEPVHQGFDEHGAWTEWKFAAGTTRYGPYWEIRPTEATRRFVRSHSRLEVVAAVGPYVTDPAMAPKAVAVLAALPVGDRHQLSFTSGFATLLAENGGREPGSKPAWEAHHYRSAHSNLLAVYGGPNAADRRTAASAGATLDAAIAEVISAMHVPQPVSFTATSLTDQRRYPDWETTIATAPLPEVSTEFRSFMKRWPREWLATVLYPYALRNDPFRSSPREKLVWILGREAEYWPFSASIGFPREKHERAWEREVGEFVRGVCAGAPQAARGLIR
jgi:hypothetical protein